MLMFWFMDVEDHLGGVNTPDDTQAVNINYIHPDKALIQDYRRVAPIFKVDIKQQE